MSKKPSFEHIGRAALRIALSHYVAIGMSAALGLLLISAAVHTWLGAAAAAATTVGAIVVIPPDQPAPQRGKFWQLLPAAVIGAPLFCAVTVLRPDPVALTALLVAVTFVAFLGAAWGKQGLPISISMMLAMIFALAVPPASGETTLSNALHFMLGSASYLVYATCANSVLNSRYRALMVSDTLLAIVTLMRSQAQQFTPALEQNPNERKPLVGRLLAQHAALAEQLQAARDIVLESPRTRRRQQLAAMLITALEMRDHVVACELDLETLLADGRHGPLLGALRSEFEVLAMEVERLADALLLGRIPAPFEAARLMLDAAATGSSETAATGSGASTERLAHALVSRAGHLRDDIGQLFAVARGEAEPDLAAVRANWQLFVSPTTWSWQPLQMLRSWDAPPLRHAIRAALAVGAGQAISTVLPWGGAHDYWILLTIVVVLRGSLAQTLERRNSRVGGTLLGCVLAGLLLYLHPPLPVLLLTVTLAQGLAHAFAIRRYLVTAVAATVLGLVQAHLLSEAASAGFDALERIADTLIGTALAWVFSYVLPSWERSQIPALVSRTLAAQARHVNASLDPAQLRAVDNAFELGWRLARRDVYDSLSALAQAAQRSLVEPRAVRPPLEPLGRLLASSYQLIAQLTSVKSMLLLRRDRLDQQAIREPMVNAARAIEAALSTRAPADPVAATDSRDSLDDLAELPHPLAPDLTPWLLRRLRLATDAARRVGIAAGELRLPAAGR